MRAVLALALLAVLAVPSGAAQEEAFYTVSGVEYYYSAGAYGSGHFATGSDPATQVRQDFDGCAWAKLRPDTNKGRFQALGDWRNLPLVIDASDFADANRTPDSMLGGGLAPPATSGLGQPLATEMLATSSNATVRVGDLPILDPVTGAPTFQATWFVTPKGYRSDADGAVVDPGDGGWEMHLRVGSPAGAAAQGPASWQAAEPSDGTPYLAPDEGHTRLFAVANERLFGHATLTASATSLGLPGSTELDFTVYAPDGTMQGTFHLAPALNGQVRETLEFPLDMVGTYYVEVHGPVRLASYTLDVQQATPEEFVLDLWWDDVRPGYAGLQARGECSEALRGAIMSGFVAPRPQPTAFDWEFSLFTVGAGLTLIAVTAALAVAAWHAVAARRAIQG